MSSSSSTATVILKDTALVGGELVEKIEINELPTGTILQLQHNSDDLSNVQYVTTAGEVFETTNNFQIEGSSESVSGNTYIFNEETGELQLIDFNNVTTIEGEEVEIVSVDSKDIIFGGFQSGLQFVDDGSFHNSEIQSTIEVSDTAPPIVSKSEVPSSSSSCITLSRPKNQPALLRNSRKVAGPSSSNALGGGTLPKTKSDQSAKSKSSGKQVFFLEGQSKVVQDNSGPVALDNSYHQLPPGFYTYQNIPADQVTTELITSVDLNQIGNNVIFLTDPGEGSSSLTQTPSQSVIGSNSEIATPKSPKKKRSKKVIGEQKQEAEAPKKKTSSGSRGAGTLEARCLEEGCGVVAHNVNELRKHLTEVHDLIFDLERKEFTSDAVFKEWRQQYEKDRMVSFIYRGGTKKISVLQSVTYMICHRSGHYKPTMADTATRKRKMKPQGSCKIGGYCTAGIKLVRNLEDGEILADICHTHYGHPLDSEALPHLRVNPVLKRMLVKKFEEGMNFAEMLAYIHHNPDGLEGLRVVDRRAIRNIFDTWRKSREDNSKIGLSSQTTAENSQKLARTEDYHSSIKTLKSSTKEEEPSTSKDTTSLVLDEQKEDVSVPILFPAVAQQIADEHSSNQTKDPPLLIAIDSVKSLKYTEEKLSNQKTDCFSGKSTRSSKDKLVILKTGSISCGKKSSDKMAFAKVASLKGNISKKKNKLLLKKPNTRSSTTAASKASLENAESQSEQQITSDISENLDDDSYQIQISPQLEASIEKLHNHGEAGPTILMYKKMGTINVKYGGFCRAFKEDDFCLIVQTPVQRQIFQLFPKIVSFEILEGPKSNINTTSSNNDSSLKLAFISVLDDFREAIPVAWMIADAICPRYLNQFFRILRYHCGELPVLYLMAPRNTEILKSWSAHFSHKPKILQNGQLAKRDLRTLLCRHFPNDNLRNKAWAVVENLINEKSAKKVKIHRDELFKLTHHGDGDHGKIYWRKMDKDWFSRIEEWSFAYRVGIQVNLLFAEESFLKLRRFISFKGTKHLNQCIDPILKIGYDKCFLRAKRMFKGDQKLSRLIERLDTCHEKAVTSLNQVDIEDGEEFKWKLEGERGELVEVFYLRSPCDCKIKCKSCRICMHEYMCTCDEFLKVQTMCAHIHKVHCERNGISLELPEKKENCKGKIESKPGNMVIKKTNEESSEYEEAVGSSSLLSSTAGEMEEITIINESDLEHLNISEVLGLLGGVSSIHSQQNAGGQGLEAQIVSITDIDTQKVIYSSGSSPLAIFRLDPD